MASAKRGKNREGRMSLAEHFIELRKRLFRAAIGLLVGAVAEVRGVDIEEFVFHNDDTKVPADAGGVA